MTILEARNVKKSLVYGSSTLNILNNINLVVKQSETVSITGVSGCGKSTLLSLLAGLDTASSGEVILLGNPLSQCDENKRSSIRQGKVGFVFQNFYLLPQFDALENVALACDIAGIKQSRQKAQSILKKVGLGHRLHHFPKHLSGGEQQRAALARAFVTDPKLILADEPTGSLDEKTGANVIDILFELNHQHQTTLILVTHDHAVSQQTATTYQLQDGQLKLRSN